MSHEAWLLESTRPRQAAGISLVLVGRHRECAAIDELLEGALAGESGSLIVRGEPGIGKSALLDCAAARAVGVELLRTAGVEAESDLALPACTDCFARFWTV